MKKIYAAFCLTAALFFSSCDVFMNSKNDETSAEQQSDKDSDKTPSETDDESAKNPDQKPADSKPAFEYTADNDLSAATAPFDKNLCYENADSLVLSDGDWTIVMCIENPAFFNEKAISKASVTNNNLTIDSGILKLDMPFNSEEDSLEDLPASEADFESVFKDIQDMWTSYGFEDASKYTFKNGYLTNDNTIVLILDATEFNKETFDLEKLKAGTIKVNPNRTKYVITITHEQSSSKVPVYIYKDANLNDKETLPENQNETENPKEDENQTEVENPKKSEEDLGYTAPTLPASVGTDPFKGKTFADESHKYVFGSDGTFAYYAYPGNNKPFVPRNKSAYTYNADTKLLTSHRVALLNEKDEFVSFNEYKQSIISMVNQEMANASEADKKAEINALISMTKKEFEKTSSYKAELVNGKLSLQTDYFTEVPDIKNLYLVNITCEKVNNSSVTLDLYGESNAFIMGLGTIRLEIPFEGGTYVKRFDIDKITDNTIEASGENEIWWVGENHTEEQSLVFSYAIACNNDCTLTFTISGNDAVTKTELGATDSNPNPSYQIHSAGASILEVVPE